jgi:hypothetical protein
MKIWLHFTNLLKEINSSVGKGDEEDEERDSHRELFRDNHEVIDVTLSITTQPKLQQIF